MTNTNIEILSNGQAAQEQGAGQVPCTTDTKEVVQRFPAMLYNNHEIPVDVESLLLTMAVTKDYLDGIDRYFYHDFRKTASRLRQKTIDAFKDFNKIADEQGTQRLTVPKRLNACQVAQLYLALNHVVLVPMPDKEPYIGNTKTTPMYECEVLVYRSGGIYSRENFFSLVEKLFPRLDWVEQYAMMEAIQFWLHLFAEKAELYHGQELIPVMNGIFNCQTKQLMPFSPKYVFLDKEYVFCLETSAGLVMHHHDGRDEPVDDWLKRIRENSGGGN